MRCMVKTRSYQSQNLSFLLEEAVDAALINPDVEGTEDVVLRGEARSEAHWQTEAEETSHGQAGAAAARLLLRIETFG